MSTELASQLSLFDRLVTAEPGQLIKHPLTADRIGGQLFETVSRGMYTKPQHAVREYVQNAIDAGAQTVRIQITANSVVITDDGSGMDPNELDHARDFGSSEKSYGEDVGFRGIGIYSALHLCDSITLTTKVVGMTRSTTLILDCRGMREQLRKDRQKTRKNRTQLIPLADNYTSFVQRDEVESEAHFTVVTLTGINPTYIAKLSDHAELKRYIIQNLPVAFADDFPGKDEILSQLRALMPSFNAARIVLQSEAGPAETITRPAIPNLKYPEMRVVKRGGKPIFLIWYALHRGGSKIPDIPYRDYQGFVYKVMGFTIGDNLRLQSMFKKGNQGLYKWYTGEVYVLDRDVVPTTERDDFEASAAFNFLESELRKVMTQLDEEALKYQETERAKEVFRKCFDAFYEVQRKIADSTAFDRADTFDKLQSIWRDLKNKRSKAKDWKAPDGTDAGRLLAEVTALRDAVQAAINKPQRGDEHVRDLASRGVDTEEDHEAQGGNSTGTREQESTVSALGNLDDDLEPEPPPPARTLVSVLRDAGWLGSSWATRMVAVVDDALSDVLGPTSVEYESILIAVENRLAAGLTG